MKSIGNRIPIFDIYTASHLELNGVIARPALRGGKVVFEFEPAEKVYEPLSTHEQNRPTAILDYEELIRRLRSQMFYVKSQAHVSGGRS